MPGLRSTLRSDSFQISHRRPPFLLVLFALAKTVAAATWIVPGVANIQTANNAHYSSHVRVLNWGSAATAVTFENIPKSNDSVPAPVVKTVGAGETLVLRNVLSTLWSVETIGALRITADQPL